MTAVDHRPGDTATGVALLCAALAVSTLMNILKLDDMAAGVAEAGLKLTYDPSYVVAAAVVLSPALMGYLLYKAYMGANWPRIALAALFLVGLYGAVAYSFDAATEFIDAIASGAVTALNATGYIFLFSKESNAWYREQRKIKSSS